MKVLFRTIMLGMISIILFINGSRSQGVSVNTSNEAPDPSAILDVQSTGQGVLFPRMTTAQRDAIQNPADGLHIFNLNTESLEYYDSSYRLWISYCSDCTPYYDTLRSSIDQDTTYFTYYLPDEAMNYKKIHIVVESEVTICGAVDLGCFCIGTAINLSAAKPGAGVIIENYGNIIGYAGGGGYGGETTMDGICFGSGATNGSNGYDAIRSWPGTKLTVHNHGIIGGGGGGGGGGAAGQSGDNTGGGGGGGAGYNSAGGRRGYMYYMGFFCIENTMVLAQDGQPGTMYWYGTGGNGGQSGSPLFAGYAGGNGGGLGEPGQNGDSSFYNVGGLGGQPGKAIGGNPGNNVVINHGFGSVFGVVD